MLHANRLRACLLASGVSLGSLARTAAADPGVDAPPGSPFRIHGYAIASYSSFDWDTDPGRRATMDLDRLTAYPVWAIAPRLELRSEVEFEHGGTGAAVEFDKFEEFGEFEYEIEKGGEVLLEQMHAHYAHATWLNVSMGRFKLPIGLAQALDEPTESFLATSSETESDIMPVNWYENGIRAEGRLHDAWSYSVSLVNGLDSSGFSSASFVARGHQTRFETVNAEDLALVAHFDWQPSNGFALAGAVYHGDSANNRPKPDLAVGARVTILEADATVRRGPLIVRALFLRGTLENADLVSAANRNLSNNLNVKRTPVGSLAQGFFVEAGLDVLGFRGEAGASLVVFARHDAVDSMHGVEGTVFDNPRWDRSVWSGGLNWGPFERAVLKFQYTHRALGTTTNDVERTYTTGLGLEF
jgi:hypothetical protein